MSNYHYLKNVICGVIDFKANDCLKNIFHNFIPNIIIKCNYRHSPWMKTKLKEGSKPAKKYYKNGDIKSNLDKVIAKSNECTETISAAKDKVNV